MSKRTTSCSYTWVNFPAAVLLYQAPGQGCRGAVMPELGRTRTRGRHLSCGPKSFADHGPAKFAFAGAAFACRPRWLHVQPTLDQLLSSRQQAVCDGLSRAQDAGCRASRRRRKPHCCGFGRQFACIGCEWAISPKTRLGRALGLRVVSSTRKSPIRGRQETTDVHETLVNAA